MSNTHQQIVGNLIKQKGRSHDEYKPHKHLPKINREKYDDDQRFKEVCTDI
jgi:hypothetical protein